MELSGAPGLLQSVWEGLVLGEVKGPEEGRTSLSLSPRPVVLYTRQLNQTIQWPG